MAEVAEFDPDAYLAELAQRRRQAPVTTYTPGQGDRSMEGGWETSSKAPMTTLERTAAGVDPYVTIAVPRGDPRYGTQGQFVTASGESQPAAATDTGPGVRNADVASSNPAYARNTPPDIAGGRYVPFDPDAYLASKTGTEAETRPAAPMRDSGWSYDQTSGKWVQTGDLYKPESAAPEDEKVADILKRHREEAGPTTEAQKQAYVKGYGPEYPEGYGPGSTSPPPPVSFQEKALSALEHGDIPALARATGEAEQRAGLPVTGEDWAQVKAKLPETIKQLPGQYLEEAAEPFRQAMYQAAGPGYYEKPLLAPGKAEPGEFLGKYREQLGQLVSGFSTPKAISELMSFAVPGASQAWATDVVMRSPDLVNHITDTAAKTGWTSPETFRAVADAAAQVLPAAHIGIHEGRGIRERFDPQYAPQGEVDISQLEPLIPDEADRRFNILTKERGRPIQPAEPIAEDRPMTPQEIQARVAGATRYQPGQFTMPSDRRLANVPQPRPDIAAPPLLEETLNVPLSRSLPQPAPHEVAGQLARMIRLQSVLPDILTDRGQVPPVPLEPTGPGAETAVEKAMRRTGQPLRSAADIAEQGPTALAPSEPVPFLSAHRTNLPSEMAQTPGGAKILAETIRQQKPEPTMAKKIAAMRGEPVQLGIGEQRASTEPIAEGLGVRGEGAGVGPGASLRQPGIAAKIREQQEAVRGQRRPGKQFRPEVGAEIPTEIPRAREQPQPGARTVPETAPLPAGVSIKNAAVEASRVARGLEPVERAASQGWGAAWDQSGQQLAADPELGRRLVEEHKDKPKAADDVVHSHLLREEIRRTAEYDAATEAVNKAAPGSPEHVAAVDRQKQAYEAYRDANAASVNAGTGTGRGLAARQMLADHNYDLLNVKARMQAARKGAPLTPKLEKLTEKLTKAEKAKGQEVAASVAQDKIKLKPKPESGAIGATGLAGREREIVPKSKLFIEFGRNRYPVDSLADAGKKFEQARDQAILSGAGTGAVPVENRIVDGTGKVIGRVSPNGRVFDTKGNVIQERGSTGTLAKRIKKLPGEKGETGAVGSITGKVPASAKAEKAMRTRVTRLTEAGKKQLREAAGSKARIAEAEAKGEEAEAPYVFKKPTKTQYQYSPETERLRGEHQAIKNQIEREIRKQEELSDPAWKRYLRTGAKVERNMLLLGGKIFPKLGAAAATRFVSQPIEQAAGSVIKAPLHGLGALGDIASKIKGLKTVGGRVGRLGEVARQASLSGFQPKAEWEALKGGVKGYKQSWKRLKGERPPEEELYGKPQLEPRSWLDYPGQSHAAIKAGPQESGRARAKNMLVRFQEKKLTEQYGKGGYDINDPKIQQEIGELANQEAKRMIFMQDNFASEGLSHLVNSLQKNKKFPVSGPLSAFALKVLFPIVKVPTNIAGEVGVHAFGVGTGLAKLGHVLGRSTEVVTPAEANMIMRHLSKGSIGLGLMTAGYFMAANGQVGGFYEPGKREEGAVQPMGMRFGGVNVPAYLLHAPAWIMMQAGATLYHASHHRNAKGELDQNGPLRVAKGFADEIPFVKETGVIDSLVADNWEGEKTRGALASRLVIPQGIRELAPALDPLQEPYYRAPKGGLDFLKKDIPFLREQVRVKGPGLERVP